MLKPRLDWSPLGVTKSLSHAPMVSLGVKFKISDEHPRLFHMESPPPGQIRLNGVTPKLNAVSDFQRDAQNTQISNSAKSIEDVSKDYCVFLHYKH